MKPPSCEPPKKRRQGEDESQICFTDVVTEGNLKKAEENPRGLPSALHTALHWYIKGKKAQRDGACSGLVVVGDSSGHEDVLVERQRGEPEGDDHPVPCGGGGVGVSDGSPGGDVDAFAKRLER